MISLFVRISSLKIKNWFIKSWISKFQSDIQNYAIQIYLRTEIIKMQINTY